MDRCIRSLFMAVIYNAHLICLLYFVVEFRRYTCEVLLMQRVTESSCICNFTSAHSICLVAVYVYLQWRRTLEGNMGLDQVNGDEVCGARTTLK